MSPLLFVLLGLVLLFLIARERALYHENHPPRRRHHETAARAQVRPRTGEVNAAPIDCPIYPLDMARARRASRPDRPAA